MVYQRRERGFRAQSRAWQCVQKVVRRVRKPSDCRRAPFMFEGSQIVIRPVPAKTRRTMGRFVPSSMYLALYRPLPVRDKGAVLQPPLRWHSLRELLRFLPLKTSPTPSRLVFTRR